VKTKTSGFGDVSEICQPLVPLLVVTIGSCICWLFRQRDKFGRANSGPCCLLSSTETTQRGVGGVLQLWSCIRDLHTIRYLIPCQSLGTTGEIKYKTVMLGPVRDAKFTWDQSDWLGKLQKWDFEQANQLRIF